jgi:hypothetical protein
MVSISALLKDKNTAAIVTENLSDDEPLQIAF